MNAPEKPKNRLPATIQQAGVTSDLRAPNVVPALIADLGDEAAWRYVEFFTANIRNPHTRRAYARACNRFFAWCEECGLMPAAIRPHYVATYIEQLQKEIAAPSVKQQLAAVRMLFDWLVIGQVVPTNPAAAVRGPKACREDADAGPRRQRMAQIAQVDLGYDVARFARPDIDRHLDLQLRAHQRGLEDEGRGSPAAWGRLDGPIARRKAASSTVCRVITRSP